MQEALTSLCGVGSGGIIRGAVAPNAGIPIESAANAIVRKDGMKKCEANNSSGQVEGHSRSNDIPCPKQTSAAPCTSRVILLSYHNNPIIPRLHPNTQTSSTGLKGVVV